MAREHNKSSSSTLLEHLEQTYIWLDRHSTEAEPFLRQFAEDEALFLNVDTTPNTTDDWNWKKASEIVLNDFDSGPLQHPRAFIRPYRRLLEVSGAETIHQVETKDPLPISNPENHLLSMRTTLDKMRTGICTDMRFTFKSPDERPLLAHRTYLAMYSPYFLSLFSTPSRSGDRVMMTTIPIMQSRRCAEQLLGRFNPIRRSNTAH